MQVFPGSHLRRARILNLVFWPLLKLDSSITGTVLIDFTG